MASLLYTAVAIKERMAPPVNTELTRQNAETLTGKLKDSIANPAEGDDFDINHHLKETLEPLGLSPDSGGGKVDFIGADPILPSTVRLAGATSIALAAKSLAVAKVWKERTGEGQDISMDLRVAPHRLCPFYDGKWELLNGIMSLDPAEPSLAFSFMNFYRTADDRYILPLNPYPGVVLDSERLLGTHQDTVAVARAISKWKGTDLEDAAEYAGVNFPMVRTVEEFMKTLQYREFLARLPLVSIEKIGESEPIHFSPKPTSPLDGVKVLGRGHVIAGGAVGRTLALHGADVLNIWYPNEYEIPAMYLTSNVGVRSSTLDMHGPSGQEHLTNLLPKADVFYANRRPGSLESVGLTAEEMAARRPGIIHASVSLNGCAGPWAPRVGFDQTAGALTGIMHLEGDSEKPGLPPVPVVNDNICAWLLSAGIVEALSRRAKEGGSYKIHISLTRVALWILSMGIFNQDYAIRTANGSKDHLYLDPSYFEAKTPLGLYRGIEEQIKMSKTPGKYPFILVPQGSCKPEWLEK